MIDKLYNFIPEEDRRLLSLNFLLAQKITYGRVSLDLKSLQSKQHSLRNRNSDYLPMIFYKHISHYLSNIEKIPILHL